MGLEAARSLRRVPKADHPVQAFCGALLREIVDTQNRIGLALWKEFSAAYQRVLAPFQRT
jgi:hypothetical protein